MGMEEFDRLIKKVEKAIKAVEEYVSERIREEISRIYEEARSLESMFKPLWHSEGFLEPLYTIKDLGDRIVVQIDLPYAEEGTIDVKFVENRMFVKAKLKSDVVFSDWHGRMRETKFNEYRLVIDLPLKVDPNRVDIKVRKGILQIIILK